LLFNVYCVNCEQTWNSRRREQRIVWAQRYKSKVLKLWWENATRLGALWFSVDALAACPHGHVPVPAVCVVPAPLPSSPQARHAEMHTHVYKYEHLSLIKVLDWFSPRRVHDAFRAHARYAKVAGTHARYNSRKAFLTWSFVFNPFIFTRFINNGSWHSVNMFN